MLRSSLLLLLALLSLPAVAQGVPLDPEAETPEAEAPAPAPEPVVVRRPAPIVGYTRDTIRGPRRLGGPRTGITVLSPALVRRLNEAFDDGFCSNPPCDDSPTISESFPVVTQFGWQFERRMFQAESGLTGVTEWVLLVAGAEQGLFLPSATFLAGVRAPGGLEIGVGPNLSLSGAAYAIAVGVNNEIGDVNVPLNLAVVLGRDGPRASLLVGFNVSERRW